MDISRFIAVIIAAILILSPSLARKPKAGLAESTAHLKGARLDFHVSWEDDSSAYYRNLQAQKPKWKATCPQCGASQAKILGFAGSGSSTCNGLHALTSHPGTRPGFDWY